MRERVQVQDLPGPEPIRPISSPNVPTVAARRRDTSGGAAARLAQSLAEISPKINATLRLREERRTREETARATDRIRGMTYDEARKAVAEGRLRETENPYFDAAFRKQFGLRHAAKRREQIAHAYTNSFDRRNGDIEEFLTGFVKEDAELFGGDKFIAHGLREGMKGFLEKVRSKHADYISGEVKEEAVEGFLDLARDAAKKAIVSGGDVSAAVRAIYKDHKVALGLDFKTMDKQIMVLASELAETGDVQSVRALLESKRKGVDGTELGSLLENKDYSLKGQNIIKMAVSRRAEKSARDDLEAWAVFHEAASRGELTDAQRATVIYMASDKAKLISPGKAAALLRANERALLVKGRKHAETAFMSRLRASAASKVMEGNGNLIQDITIITHTGKEKKISADELRKGALNSAVTQLLTGGRGVDGKAEPPRSVAQVADMVAKWGVNHNVEIWENDLTAGASAISGGLVKDKDGNVALPPAAERGFALYMGLAAHPALRARHIKDSRAARIYADAETLVRFGFTKEDALVRSATVDRDERGDTLGNSIKNKELAVAVDDVVDATDGSWFGRMFGGSATPENPRFASKWVERYARTLLAFDGVTVEKALEVASEKFVETHSIVNGYLINTRNRDLPPDFSDMSKHFTEQFVAQHNKRTGDDLGADDIVLKPSFTGSNSWVIVNKATGIPGTDWGDAKDYTFTTNELNRRWGAIKDHRKTTRGAEARIRSKEAIEKAKTSDKLDAARPAGSKIRITPKRSGPDVLPSGDMDSLREYLSRYPDGKHAAKVRSRIKELSSGKASKPLSTPKEEPKEVLSPEELKEIRPKASKLRISPKRSGPEVLPNGDLESLKEYLSKHPKGKHAAKVKARILELSSQSDEK